MDEERITRLLGSLPREQASPHFTAAVLRRIEAGAAPPRPLRRWAVAACAAVLLAAAGFGVHQWSEERLRDRQRQEALARLEVLEAEKRALEAEIARLQRQARDAQPVVYLGSTPNLDMVLDFSRLARRRAQTPGGQVRAPGGQVRPANLDRRTIRPQGEHRR